MPRVRPSKVPRVKPEASRWRWRSRPMLALFVVVGLLGTAMAWKGLSHRLAVHHLDLRNYETAELWLDRARRIPAWSAGDDHFWQARLARKLLQTERSESELTLAERQGGPKERIRRERLLLQAQSGRLVGVMHELQQWLINSDEDGAELCEAFANGLLVNSLSQDAAAVIAAWKKEYPQDPQPFVTWGRWLESQQLTDAAEQEYRAALKLRQNFAPALYALGRLQLNRGTDLRQAQAQFAAAAAGLQARTAAWIGEARCLHQLGETARARQLLERVLALGEPAVQRSFALVQDPDPTLPAERLLSEILTGLGEMEQALPLLNRLLEREPRDPTLRYLRAQCLQGTGRDQEAQQLFQEVAADREAIAEADRLVDEIRQHPGDPQIEKRFRVGELFWQHDSTRKAEYWLRNTVALAPRHPSANRLLADCYELRAKFDSSMQAAAEYHRQLADAGP